MGTDLAGVVLECVGARKNQVDDGGGDGELRLTGGIEQGLEIVGEILQGVEVKESGTSLEGVEGAEDGVDCTGIGGVLLENKDSLLDVLE